jgi:Kef-type K+ transport system membrane component KefB
MRFDVYGIVSDGSKAAETPRTIWPAMNATEVFLIAMLIILTVPYAVWRLGRTEHFAPLVVVQILTGITLGPGVLGAVFPEYYQFVFSPPVIQSLNGIAWWAVSLFVFMAGVELDLRAAWKDRRESGITAGLALGVPVRWAVQRPR